MRSRPLRSDATPITRTALTLDLHSYDRSFGKTWPL